MTEEKKESGRQMKSQRLMEILMQQNSQLEREIERLHAEIDETTKGVLKRGYLNKFRDREISFASRWGLRYFVLQGQSISYYVDDRELRARRTIDLTGCLIRDEGTKRGGFFHVFSVYWPSEEEGEDAVGSLLLRLSCDNKAEAQQWMAMLEEASRCALTSREDEEDDADDNNNGKENDTCVDVTRLRNDDTVPTLRVLGEPSGEQQPSVGSASAGGGDEDFGLLADVELSPQILETLNESEAADHHIALETLKRVRSSSRMLQKSLSRQVLGSSNGTPGRASPLEHKQSLGHQQLGLRSRHQTSSVVSASGAKKDAPGEKKKRVTKKKTKEKSAEEQPS